MKRINFKRYKRYRFFLLYVIGFILLTNAVYLTIPVFFNYESSKKNIENKIYKQFNIKTSIQGEIKYRPLPSPRIKIKKLLIKDVVDSTRNLGEVEKVVLAVPFKSLTKLDKVDFDKLELQNAEINLDLNHTKQYKDFFSKKFKSKNIRILGGNINFFDEKKHVLNLSDIDIKFNSSQTLDETIVKGNLFNDNVTVNFKNKKEINSSKIFSIKFPKLKFRANTVLSMPDSENFTHGNTSINYYHNNINLVFDWKDSTIKIKNGTIKNEFLKGKVTGDINFLPFFNFDLSLDLGSFNFGSLFKKLVKLDKSSVNNLFILNEKINGDLNLNVNKIYSSSKLIKSVESRIKFVNKNILVDQFLIDLGKLGAADITGLIKNDDNYSNFTFRKNLFIDNSKYFYSKFGVYNKSTDAKNLFIEGNFNLNKPKIRLNELVVDEPITKEDLIYYQEEFNNVMLDDGYKTFFNFFRLKEYVSLIAKETN